MATFKSINSKSGMLRFKGVLYDFKNGIIETEDADFCKFLENNDNFHKIGLKSPVTKKSTPASKKNSKKRGR